MLSRCFLDFSVGVRASVIGLSQISSFSLMKRRISRPFTQMDPSQTIMSRLRLFPLLLF